jgi:hypothetical protein
MTNRKKQEEKSRRGVDDEDEFTLATTSKN